MFQVNLLCCFDNVNCQVNLIAILSIVKCLDYRFFSLFKGVQTRMIIIKTKWSGDRHVSNLEERI